MKAIVKSDPPDRPGIVVAEVPDPTISTDDEVLVSPVVSSISGSELNIWRGKYRLPTGNPVDSGRILGYEHAGTVLEAGKDAHDAGFEFGTRVALASPFVPCRICVPCQMGMWNRCRNWGHVGLTLDGTNAEMTVLPMEVLQIVDRRVEDLDAAFLNTAALSIRAVAAAALRPGSRVVIVGPGPVGLLLLQAAQIAGASWVGVIGQESDGPRLKLAEELGAHFTAVASPSTVKMVQDFTGGLGPETVLEAAGTQEGATLAVDLVAVGGTVVMSGLPPEGYASIPVTRITRDEITVRGVEGNLESDRRLALRLMAEGRLRARPLVTHRYPIDDAELAFTTAYSGEGCKVVLEISGS